MCVNAFCYDVFLQVIDVRTVGLSAGVFGVLTVNIFSSVNKMMLTSLAECFEQLV